MSTSSTTVFTNATIKWASTPERDYGNTPTWTGTLVGTPNNTDSDMRIELLTERFGCQWRLVVRADGTRLSTSEPAVFLSNHLPQFLLEVADAERQAQYKLELLSAVSSRPVPACVGVRLRKAEREELQRLARAPRYCLNDGSKRGIAQAGLLMREYAVVESVERCPVMCITSMGLHALAYARPPKSRR